MYERKGVRDLLLADSNNDPAPVHQGVDGGRRHVIGALGASALTLLSGCCSWRAFPKPLIFGTVPNGVPHVLKPVVVKSAGAPAHCIDVHAHFFNASDVTVKGFLKGPVAYSKDGGLRVLIEALAGIGDALGGLAPTAAEEYRALLALSAREDLREATSRARALGEMVSDHQTKISAEFYELVRGRAFERQYNDLQNARAALLPDELRSITNIAPLDRESLARAMRTGNLSSVVREGATRRATAVRPYPDGVLVFVGCMLSSRWMNLHEYAQAYSSSADSFGIDQTLGAMVDFDRWLECAPRSAYDDQIRVFQLLSAMSGGYLKCLAAYNPWTDIKENGAHLENAIKAVTDLGFVGIKIYPPNGFRPYGNETAPIAVHGGPTGVDLDRVLGNLWSRCADLNIPVMAHTGESMGKDASTDDGADPIGWQALLARSMDHAAPIVNLGHLGGDDMKNNWTSELASKMTSSAGAGLYGDVAYWDKLRCIEDGNEVCQIAEQRLATALEEAPLAKRVMYGSDWHMLSQEPSWATYPFDIASATRNLPIDPVDLFGGNALRCFGSRLQSPS
jgi:predicted TIM-barrel fold metal-dependent hydrolase